MATVNRSSKTGKFVTPKYAKKHKASTETETVAYSFKGISSVTFRKIVKFIERVEKGQFGELKGEFISARKREATAILKLIK